MVGLRGPAIAIILVTAVAVLLMGSLGEVLLADSATASLEIARSLATSHGVHPVRASVGPPIHLGPRLGDSAQWGPPARLGQSSTALLPATVLDTLVLSNHTLLPGNVVPAGNGEYPTGVAVDERDGKLFVAAEGGTLAVVNLSSDRLVDVISVGAEVFGVAYDATNGEVYASLAYGGDRVTVIDAATDRVTGSIGVGSVPAGVTVDPANGNVYVMNSNSSNVSVINGTSDRVTASIPVGATPFYMAVGAANGRLFVTNDGADTVSIINATSDQVVGTTGVGILPGGIAYNAANGNVYVVNCGQGCVSPGGANGSVTVLNGSTGSVVTTIPVGLCPWGATSDAQTKEVDVVDTTCTAPTLGYVSVINGSTNAVTSTVAVGIYPYTIEYDPAGGRLYTANYYSNNVTILNGGSHRVVGAVGSGEFPEAVAYDLANDRMYVANWGGNDVAVLNGTTGAEVGTIGSWYGPDGLAYDTATGDLYVANSESNNVTIINTSTGRVVGTVAVGSDPKGIAYDPTNGDLFVANCFSRNVTAISGTNLSVIRSIPAGLCPTAVAYDPANGNLYVANSGSVAQGAVSNITVVSGVTGQPIASIVENGSAGSMQPLGLAYDGRDHEMYVADGWSTNPAYSGSILAIDSVTEQVVAWVPLNSSLWGSPGGIAYDSRSGDLLVTGTNYLGPSPRLGGGVFRINGTTNTALDGETAVGLFPGALNFDEATGGAFVANYGSGTLSILNLTAYPPPKYLITFHEVDLAAGTPWSVSLNGTMNRSTTLTLGFAEPSGTYSFSVGSVAGYLVHPAQGSFSVAGQNVTIVITFERLYAVTVTETGLPPGTPWSVVWNGTQWSATSAALVLSVPNGTFSYAIPAVDNYTSMPTRGTVVVNGSGRSLAVVFLPPPPRVVSFTVNRTTVTVGEPVTVRVVVADGQAPLSYRYAGGPSGCGAGNVSTFSCTAGVAGNYTLNVWVTDHAGRIANATVAFAVTEPPLRGGSPFLGLPGKWGYLLVGVLAASVAVGLGIVVWRRNCRAPPRANQPVA